MLCKLVIEDTLLSVYNDKTDVLIKRLQPVEARQLVTPNEIEWLEDGCRLTKRLTLGGNEDGTKEM